MPSIWLRIRQAFSTGLPAAARSKGSERQGVYIKPRRGKLITPPTSRGDRYAYVIATGETDEAARANARAAAGKIRFIYEPLDPAINNLIHSQA